VILVTLDFVSCQVYPLFAATGVAVGICAMQLIRNITTNPEVRYCFFQMPYVTVVYGACSFRKCLFLGRNEIKRSIICFKQRRSVGIRSDVAIHAGGTHIFPALAPARVQNHVLTKYLLPTG
jgi:hypothetical protein